ncbi:MULTISPECIES: BRO-N domain-containing protein [Eubacterium]|uniref:hypothetical protein n=1 Tax=Eubacterium TaxID=1730 RepID=UPI001CC80B24|nr:MULTISPECIES: hypothetical protein [Eubacterium]
MIFSIIDVVGALIESKNAGAYWQKLKQRLKVEGNQTVTKYHSLKMVAAGGEKRMIDVVDAKQPLRIIQSISSPKTKPFKAWLACVGSERIEET